MRGFELTPLVALSGALGPAASQSGVRRPTLTYSRAVALGSPVRVLQGQITIRERDQEPRECSGETNADLLLNELVAGRLRKTPPTAARSRRPKPSGEIRISDSTI